MDLMLMTEYLLGEMPAFQREKLEELLFSDPDLYHTLMIAEDRLIDDYLCSQLSRMQQIRFERYFLISERRREKLALGRLFHTALGEFADDPYSRAESLWPAPRALRRIFLVALLAVSFLFVAGYLMIWR